MNNPLPKPRLAISLLALAAVSACGPTVTGFSAGGPSSHTPQSYEPVTSTAASTSTLGGSAVTGLLSTPGGLTTGAATGALTHDTGRIEINDGTYLFVDATGPTGATGSISDGAGASGNLGAAGAFQTVIANGYSYVLPYKFNRVSGGQNVYSGGFVGMTTAAVDMPNGGTAAYSGQAELFMNLASSGYSALNNGTSAVDVDFGAGTATVDLAGFGTTGLIDEMRGTGITISGAHFTGGSWVTLKGGSVVNVVGASPTSTSNGTFFGYDPSISAPAEVAGLVVLNGSTGYVLGIYAAR